MSLPRDLRLAMRRLTSAPWYTAFTILSVGAAIGIAGGIYSVVRAVFGMPMGISHPERLAPIVLDGQIIEPAISVPDYEDLRHRQTSFQTISASVSLRVSVTARGYGIPVFAEAVSEEYFETIGVAFSKGRPFGLSHNDDGGDEAVISFRFWKGKLNGDLSVVGRTLEIATRRFLVVGIVGPEYEGFSPFAPTEIWLPLRVLQAGEFAGAPAVNRRDLRVLQVWGRLRLDVPRTAASAEIAAIGRQLDADFPPASVDSRRMWSVQRDAAEVAGARRVGAVLKATAVVGGLVIILAVLNLSNVAIARGVSRTREIALRIAIGASRPRILYEEMSEGILVGALGSAVGLVVIIAFTKASAGPLPLRQDVDVPFTPTIDASVAVVLIAFCLFATAASGLWPALQCFRGIPLGSLSGGGHITPRNANVHRVLVTWQVCGSVVLFLSALFCVNAVSGTVQGYQHVFDERTAIAQLNFSVNGIRQDEAARLTDLIVLNIRQRGIPLVSASTGLPAAIPPSAAPVSTLSGGIKGRRERVGLIATTTPLFEILKLKLVRGRVFTPEDGITEKVAVISESLARTLFDTPDVLGRRIVIHTTKGILESEATVIGVTADDPALNARGNAKSQGFLVYVPLWQRYEPILTIAASGSSAGAALSAVTNSIRSVDPRLAINIAGSGRDVAGRRYALTELGGRLMLLLGSCSLVLALAGLYGILAQTIASRMRELAIRTAIGATRATVTRLLLIQSLQPVVVGIGLGLIGGSVCRLVLRSLIVTDVSVLDLESYAVLPTLCLMTALAASFIPAWKASRINPSTILRQL